MIIDYSLKDFSSEFARKTLNKGMKKFKYLLDAVSKKNELFYIALPDFSITLKQRRLIFGMPIGGYLKWTSSPKIFPLELDVNPCGVHLLKLHTFCENEFITRLYEIKQKLDKEELSLRGKILKWNFTARNHFINIYKYLDDYYMLSHSSGESVLSNWHQLNNMFGVKYINIDGEDVPYIVGDDAIKYFSIAREESVFFHDRHNLIFDLLLEGNYENVYSDRHFGLVDNGELLMGCSKVEIGSKFPILTRPFQSVFMATVNKPPDDIVNITNGFSLVPHGLGMTIPDGIVNIQTSNITGGDYVEILNRNGSKMVTNTLEYIGIDYRDISVIGEMYNKIGIDIIGEMIPVLCTKL